MPTVLQDLFSKLEDVPVAEIQESLSQKEDPMILENRLGNRMLYPQVLPQSLKDLSFDTAIIRKVIETNQAKFYNKNLKKINIPEEFIQHFPDIKKLAEAFVDGISAPGITAIWLESVTFGQKILGTLIRPENLKAGDTVTIGVMGKIFQLKSGGLVIIPVAKAKTDMTFTSSSATLIGKKILSIEVSAGSLGLIVDTRFG